MCSRLLVGSLLVTVIFGTGALASGDRASHERAAVQSRRGTSGDDCVVPLHPSTSSSVEQVQDHHPAEHQPRLWLCAGRVSVRRRQGGARRADAGGRALTATMNVTPPEPELEALRSEFLSYPGMCLTVEQVARLLDVRRDEATEVLIVLEAEGVLIRRA